MKQIKFFHIIPLVAVLFSHAGAFAQAASAAVPPTTPVPVAENPYRSALFYALVTAAVVLLIFIRQLSGILTNVAKLQSKKTGTSSKGIPMILLLVASGTMFPLAGNAQDQVLEFLHEGFGTNAINALIVIIMIELAVILYYARLIKSFLRKPEEEVPYTEKIRLQPSFWDKVNKSVDIQKEEAIMFDHSYDGIRELDNALPPWWRYGFYLTIVFAVVYMLHYHVMKTGPLSIAEYENENKEAELAIAEYRKNAASFVDESNITVLTGASDLEAGKTIFMEKCAVCHGKSGEGLVGPNFTDQYWIHGGDIKSIFTTVKYGVTAKGMQSWKEMLGAQQMSQVSSFILTFQGTNPPNQKEAQGVLYVPVQEKAATDTTAVPTDSTGVAVPADTAAVKGIAESTR